MKAFATMLIAISVITLLPLTPAVAQQACPCVPISNIWVVKSCDTWNCAASALVLANGDPYTMTISTGSTGHPWVILKRVVAGSAIDSADDDYQVDAFDHFMEATSRFTTLADGAHPMVVSAPDGKVLIVSLREQAQQKHRAVTAH